MEDINERAVIGDNNPPKEFASIEDDSTMQRDHAIQQIKAANVGDVVTIGPENRSQAQNRKMWPMLQDIKHCVPSAANFSLDDIKLIMMNALSSELKHLPTMDGSGYFPVGQRSSLLNKKQFKDLIEIIYIYGAQNDVQWSEKSQSIMNEWRGYADRYFKR